MVGAEEMSQWFRTFVTLEKKPALVPTNHMI